MRPCSVRAPTTIEAAEIVDSSGVAPRRFAGTCYVSLRSRGDWFNHGRLLEPIANIPRPDQVDFQYVDEEYWSRVTDKATDWDALDLQDELSTIPLFLQHRRPGRRWQRRFDSHVE